MGDVRKSGRRGSYIKRTVAGAGGLEYSTRLHVEVYVDKKKGITS
jgi:hypothetical protein